MVVSLCLKLICIGFVVNHLSSYQVSWQRTSPRPLKPTTVADNFVTTNHAHAKSSGLSALSTLSDAVYKNDARLRSMIASGAFQDAIDFLATTEKSGFQKSIVYIICETCGRTNSMGHIMRLLKAIPFSFKSCEGDVMPLIKKCVEDRKMQALQPIVEYLTEHHDLKLSVKSKSLLLKGYGMVKWEAMIDKSLSQMIKAGDPIDNILMNSAIDAYVRCGHTRKAMKIFQSLNSNVNLQKIISTLPEDNRDSELSSEQQPFNLIVQYFQAQSRKSTKSLIDIRTYNILLKGLQGPRKKDLDRSLLLYQLMLRHQIVPNSITINTLINACVKADNIDYAHSLLQEYSSIVSVEAYTSMIAKYAQDGLVAEAFDIFDLMVDLDIQPNHVTWNCLMNACINSKDTARAKQLLEMASKSQGQSTWTTSTILTNRDIKTLYNTYVISCLQRFTHNPSEVYYFLEGLSVLMLLNKQKIPLETPTYNALMKSLIQISYLNEAMQLLYIMKAESRTNEQLVLDDYTYSILFTALGKLGYVQEAISTFDIINKERALSIQVVNTLLSSCMKNNYLEETMAVFQQVANRLNSTTETITQPDQVTFSIMLSIVNKVVEVINDDFDEKFDLQEKISDRSISFSPSSMRFVFEKDDRIPGVKKSITNAIAIAQLDQSLLMSSSLQHFYETLYLNVTRPWKQTIQSRHEPPKALVQGDFSEFCLDSELRRLYKLFRLELQVPLDKPIIYTLNSLFGTAKNIANSNLLGNLGLNRQIDIKKETARLIFDDLVLSGVSPRQIPNIIYFCSLNRQELHNYNDEQYLRRIRQQSATMRIFYKYGWNKVQSGWSPI